MNVLPYVDLDKCSECGRRDWSGLLLWTWDGAHWSISLRWRIWRAFKFWSGPYLGARLNDNQYHYGMLGPLYVSRWSKRGTP